jgi:chemotaxis protein CheD
MSSIYVAVGEFAVCTKPSEVLKTLALGSCVGIVVYSPQFKLAGLLHVALPDSSINKKLAQQRPGMFADTGIPQLLLELKKEGYDSQSGLIVKLAGGASILDPNNTFNIGKRNVLAVRKILWSYRLESIAEDVGESISRSVSVNPESGKVVISSPGRGEWEL